jgi:integrase/recombinase XerD
MFSNCNNEIVIKLIGRLSLEFPEMDQLKARIIIEEVLYKYDVIPQETSVITTDIEEKLQMYLAVKRLEGLSKKTLKNYQYNLLIFGSYLNKPLATVTVTDIRLFLTTRCSKMKASSMNGQITILKSFFGWLVNEEYILKNPMLQIKQTKVPKRIRHAMTDEEVELIRQACETNREKALTEFMISTGCRLSEIVGVNKEDINWHEMSLNVIGKGNKERKVYFNIKAKIMLKKYLEGRSDVNSALFVASKGNHDRLGGRSIEKEIKNISKRAGFEKNQYFHTFSDIHLLHKN